MNNSMTLRLDKEDQEKLFNAWKEFQHPAPDHAVWQLRPENAVITCYQSGKVLFQGKDAHVYASAFKDKENIKRGGATKTTAKATSQINDILPQAGSDEVGTGDFFGPVCVCACIVDEKTSDAIKSLGIGDSKELTDEHMLTIGPQLMEMLPHSLLVLPNARYNQVHQENNLNAIKAKMHNQAYVHLRNKAPLPKLVVVDQFAKESTYYGYLKNVPDVVKGIHFETKAENKYPAVAAASIISRYAFLKTMLQMEELYGMKFAKGAGKPADTCARKFVSKYGFDRLGEVAKLNFKNTEKLRR